MTVFSSPGAFAAFLQGVLSHQEHAIHEGLEKGGKIIADEAKAEVGHYQDAAGPFKAWAQLKDSTQLHRLKAGHTPNDPLLIDGKHIRDTIEVIVQGHEASVGSKDKVALYQETGTTKGGREIVPPRSFLGGAAVRKQDEAINAMVQPEINLLAGKGHL
jgi:hypothetical protein